MNLGEASALLNAVIWAATGVTTKKLSPAVRPFHVVTIHSIAATAVFIVVLSASGQIANIWRAPAFALLMFTTAAALNTVGSFLFYTAISTGSVGGTYTTTTGLYVLLSVLAGAVVLGEKITPMTGLGAAGIVSGVWLLNSGIPADTGARRNASATGSGSSMQPVGPIRIWKPRLAKGLVLGAVTSAMWALGLLVLKWGLDRSDPLTAGIIRNAVATFIYLGAGAAVVRGGLVPRSGRRDWTLLMVSGTLFAGSVFTWNYALSHATAAKTAVLASAAPAFALLFAVIMLKERMSKKAVAGAAVAMAGIFVVLTAG
jgi:drug/metabolite transporter (DMT)-like permease